MQAQPCRGEPIKLIAVQRSGATDAAAMSGDEILAAIDKRSVKREWLVSKGNGAWQPLAPTQDFPFDANGVLRLLAQHTDRPRRCSAVGHTEYAAVSRKRFSSAAVREQA